MNFDCMFVYHKLTTMMPYFRANERALTGHLAHNDPQYVEKYQRIVARYREVKDMRLILMVRYERDRIVCKISCPVSPMPVKGEFEVPSLNAIKNFLDNHGWRETEVIPASLLK